MNATQENWQARAEKAEAERDNLLAVARAYEQWEAALVTSVEAWRGGTAELPTLTYPLYDELMRIQSMRNKALEPFKEAKPCP